MLFLYICKGPGRAEKADGGAVSGRRLVLYHHSDGHVLVLWPHTGPGLPAGTQTRLHVRFFFDLTFSHVTQTSMSPQDAKQWKDELMRDQHWKY